MKLITRQSKANIVADKWKTQYPEDKYSDDPEKPWANKQAILKGLIDLGEHPYPADVDKVIGNESWTATQCDNCEASGMDVLELGEEPDYESRTIHICETCVSFAKEAFNN